MVVGAEEELMILIFRDSFMKIFTKIYGIDAVCRKPKRSWSALALEKS